MEPLSFDPAKYEEEHYHQVTDEVRPEWNLEGTARDMRIFFLAALRVANAAEQPRWVAGNEFEEEWKKVYSKNEDERGRTGTDKPRSTPIGQLTATRRKRSATRPGGAGPCVLPVC